MATTSKIETFIADDNKFKAYAMLRLIEGTLDRAVLMGGLDPARQPQMMLPLFNSVIHCMLTGENALGVARDLSNKLAAVIDNADDPLNYIDCHLDRFKQMYMPGYRELYTSALFTTILGVN